VSKTIATDRGPMYLKCNNKPRDLHPLTAVPEPERHWFDYIEGDDCYSDRLFQYRGSWYDLNEFERASDQIKLLGFDGMQSQSMFDAVLVRYFTDDGYEYDGQIVVGYIHW
jgi:hypothetical protein